MVCVVPFGPFTVEPELAFRSCETRLIAISIPRCEALSMRAFDMLVSLICANNFGFSV